ncbi:Protein CBG26617 [Caenorhabditis briggsae]|uniref:Protein CBG26617 n=1 Tax=Caenorhabditis briggsae TaxID=6238 RepID=B6IL97_CAEBR|nr:Protein CBG26617 [Caenorhabditis briggsae]CAS00677.1 Protein CBG26617 [Caenorhabditis briggsae]
MHGDSSESETSRTQQKKEIETKNWKVNLSPPRPAPIPTPPAPIPSPPAPIPTPPASIPPPPAPISPRPAPIPPLGSQSSGSQSSGSQSPSSPADAGERTDSHCFSLPLYANNPGRSLSLCSIFSLFL